MPELWELITYNVWWLCLVAENTRLIFKLKTNMSSTKQTENLAECGNKSKPLLCDVILTDEQWEEWRTVCNIVVQDAIFGHKNVNDTIKELSSKFKLLSV